MNRELLARVIQHLEAVQRRPAMYVGCNDVERMVHFLNGFRVALAALLGLELQYAVRRQIEESRGWSHDAMHVYHRMVEQGMSPEQVIDELVAIEIDVWRRLAEELP